jgi:enediyne biosynthesis protein E4
MPLKDEASRQATVRLLNLAEEPKAETGGWGRITNGCGIKLPLSWILVFSLLVQPLGAQSELQQAKDLILKGDYAGARKLLEPLTSKQPKAAEPHYLMGFVALQLRDYSAAISHLRIALDAAPHDPLVLNLLAKAYILDGQKAEAETTLQRLTQLAPKDAEGWSLLGRLYQDSNRFSEAVKPLELSLQLKPDDVPTLNALAYTQVGLGDYDKALATFKKTVGNNKRLNKPMAGPHASFAIFLLRLNRVLDAEEQVRQALAIDPQNNLVIEAQRALQVRVRAHAKQALKGEVFPAPTFQEITVSAGLNFRLENSPTPFKHQIETMPGGVAILDYNQDGLMDIYFTNGAESPSLKKSGPRFWNRLYRNNGDRTFTDVTARAGVQGVGYMMGAAVADFDNDGFPDLFVVGVNRNILYHNNRDGTFTDITHRAGLDHPDPRYGEMWGIHAAWLDYDNDGWLDLLVINYCLWDPKNEPYCGDSRPGHRTYCHPSKYAALPNQLFRSNRDGTFTDVSASSGIGKYLGKGMGAATADFDGDGLIDIFVANDTEPNFLFWNKGHGKFAEVASPQGVAFNQFGTPVSSMGVDFRDLDNDGRPDLFITTLSNEGFLLFHNTGARFDDIADQAQISLPSLPSSGWSNPIVDLNNDGWKDLFSANGHVIDNIELTQSRTYHQRNSIFQNNGDGTFRDASSEAGRDFQRSAVHRGAAVADFDNDGRMDIVVTALSDRPELFHNTSPNAGHWLLVRLVGHRSNRDGLGAILRLEIDDGRTLWNQASTSVGFASASDPRVHFGLGRSSTIKSLEIRWPSGKRQKLESLKPDHILTVEEPTP